MLAQSRRYQGKAPSLLVTPWWSNVGSVMCVCWGGAGGKTDEDMVGLISSALGKKEKALGGQGDMYSLAKSKNRPMILIGG